MSRNETLGVGREKYKMYSPLRTVFRAALEKTVIPKGAGREGMEEAETVKK